jgi:UMF1 family MFS transporter
MLGRFATVLGPLVMGETARLTGSTRASILALGVLFLLGGIVLAFVPDNRPQAIGTQPAS